MERRMMGNYHVRCGVGEKVEIISKPYLSLLYEVWHITNFITISNNIPIRKMNTKPSSWTA